MARAPDGASPGSAIPGGIEFATKWEIAVAALQQMIEDGVSAAPVVADPGYGVVTAFRFGGPEA